MAREKEQRLGYLRGGTGDGAVAMVCVSNRGRDYRFGLGNRDHLRLPSVLSIEAVKREAPLVIHVASAVLRPQPPVPPPDAQSARDRARR